MRAIKTISSQKNQGQLTDSSAKHAPASISASVCKFTDSVPKSKVTPTKLKIQRFHNNLKKGGLFETQVPAQDIDHFFDPHYVAEHAATIYDHCIADESQNQPANNYMVI